MTEFSCCDVGQNAYTEKCHCFRTVWLRLDLFDLIIFGGKREFFVNSSRHIQSPRLHRIRSDGTPSKLAAYVSDIDGYYEEISVNARLRELGSPWKYIRSFLFEQLVGIGVLKGVVAPKTSGSPQIRDGWNPPRDFQPLHQDDSGDSSDMDIKQPTLIAVPFFAPDTCSFRSNRSQAGEQHSAQVLQPRAVRITGETLSVFESPLIFSSAAAISVFSPSYYFLVNSLTAALLDEQENVGEICGSFVVRVLLKPPSITLPVEIVRKIYAAVARWCIMGCGQSQFSLIYPKKFKRKDNKNKGREVIQCSQTCSLYLENFSQQLVSQSNIKSGSLFKAV
ncbi:hypothetical protein ACFE04_011427 [Oxalis oulophora]